MLPLRNDLVSCCCSHDAFTGKADVLTGFDQRCQVGEISHVPLFARRKNPAFTLVEMLVVMGVIVTLLAIIAPSFKNLIGGRAIEQSINSVTGMLELSRATAISNRTYVWVLFSNSTNSDNNAELKCAAVMSLNGTNSYAIPNLSPITKLITISNVKNLKYSQMPKAVQDVTPTEFKGDSYYIAGWYNPEGSSPFPDVVVSGYHFKGATFVRFDDTAEIGTSGDTYNLLVQPAICLGLVKTAGTVVPANTKDGAVVACYGGTAKLSVFRP